MDVVRNQVVHRIRIPLRVGIDVVIVPRTRPVIVVPVYVMIGDVGLVMAMLVLVVTVAAVVIAAVVIAMPRPPVLAGEHRRGRGTGRTMAEPGPIVPAIELLRRRRRRENVTLVRPAVLSGEGRRRRRTCGPAVEGRPLSLAIELPRRWRWRRENGSLPRPAIPAGEGRRRRRTSRPADQAGIAVPAVELRRLRRRGDIPGDMPILAISAGECGSGRPRRQGRRCCAPLRPLLDVAGLAVRTVRRHHVNGVVAALAPQLVFRPGIGRAGHQTGGQRQRRRAGEKSVAHGHCPEQHGSLHRW